MEDSFAQEIGIRFEKLKANNERKLSLSLEILPLRAKQVIHLLPLLLHFNHPLIPGYRKEYVPHGIDCFELNDCQRKFLDRVFDGARWDVNIERRDILGLYAMGSTSSIAQGSDSDFDIWVCVRKDIHRDNLIRLEEKCSFLSVFAKSQGVDLNLFITPENRFLQGYHDDLDKDNCGSAQNLFLLDEFYRTGIRLAGRYLIWPLISTEQELEDYELYKQKILELPFIDPDKFFDFGSVVKSSPTEYFGSGLWLLYKGIDAPFKAAIKILLMEVYANSYPNTRLLSNELKDRMHAGEQDPLQIDPYYAMFERVSEYLVISKDRIRLELMRKCFYFKIYRGLSGIKNPKVIKYKLGLLKKFSASFMWSEAEVTAAENKERWKVNFVRSLNKSLLHSLIESYRSLLLFSIRHGIEYAITSDDVGFLSRKLYAAYDRYPGKILVFNSELNSSLSEQSLTFIYPSKNSLCRREWHLYPCAADDIGILSMPVGYSGKSISEVIAWACFNRLLVPSTKTYVAGSRGIVTSERIRVLASDLMRLLYPHFNKETALNIQKPLEINHCVIILNFESDPTLTNLEKYDVEIGNSLSTSRQKNCLVGSIDMVYINSWGELVSMSLSDGEEGIVDLLAMLVRMTITDTQGSHDALRGIQICSYADNFRDLLRFDLESLIKRVFLYQVKKEDFSFEVGRNTYVVKNTEDRGIIITRRNAFGQGDYDISILSRYGMRPEFSLQVPSLVDRYATMGIIQYFFAPAPQGWDIYVLNERNEVKIMQDYRGERSDLVNAINRYYTNQTGDKGSFKIHFNLPQYFVLSPDLKSIHPYTIQNKQAV